MGLFSKRKPGIRPLSREESLATRPVLNRLVKMERTDDGHVMLLVPRRETAMLRAVSKTFGISPHKKVALDELGSFVIQLCDGRHTVAEIVDAFCRRFRLNRREAEVSMGDFLRNLAGRSIIGLIVEARDA